MTQAELFGLVFGVEENKTFAENLKHSTFDDMFEIDLGTGRFRSVVRVQGKYTAPAAQGSFETLFDHAVRYMVHPDDQNTYRELMNPADMFQRLQNGPVPGLLWAELRMQGTVTPWVWTRHMLVTGRELGVPEGIVRCYIFDIQLQRDRAMQEAALTVAPTVQYDASTGLLVENDFFCLAQERVGQLQGPWCFVDVEIEHFKLFSDWFGTETGQFLLTRLASRLKRTAEQYQGLAGYRGSNHFCLLLPYDRPMLEALHQDLHVIIKTMSGMEGFAPVFGLCAVEDPNENILDVYNRAAIATEELLATGRGKHIQVYNSAAFQKNAAEYQMVNEFLQALENGQITFWLQPQCSLTGSLVVGAESLVRWEKPDGSKVPPAVFVPVLEKYDVVTRMDRYIWEAVCKWLRSWIERGHEPVPVSVNVSRLDIINLDVPAHFAALREQYMLPPGCIKIEITESAYVDDIDKVRSTIARLREIGFMVLMDDFGSGYSSLNMLRDLNVDVIKLDAQFLQTNSNEEQKTISILESIISMTKNLSTPVIVEGVETGEQVQFLNDLGCPYIQGFYFHRPMPVEEFEKLIADESRVDRSGFVVNANQQMQVREFLDENIYSDSMLNNILGPVAFYQRHGDSIDITRYNEQFFELVGIDHQEFTQRICDIQRFFYPGDAEKMYALMDQAERDRFNGAKGIVRVYRPSGVLVWLSIRLYYMGEDERGKTFYGSDRDVTELQYLNTDLPGGYYRCTADADFTFLFVSQNFCEMTGFTTQEIQTQFGNKLINMVHPEDMPAVQEQAKQIRDGTLESFRPYRIRRKRGDYIYIAEQSRLTDAYGTVCWQSMALDVSEVMHTRSQMRLLARLFQGTILFLCRRGKELEYETVIHGLQAQLGMDGPALQSSLNSGEFCSWVEGYRGLPHAAYTELFIQSALNHARVITVLFPDGRVGRFTVKADYAGDETKNVEYIVTMYEYTPEPEEAQ